MRLASTALSRHGYDVLSAADGASALRVCEQRDGPIHLALLDIMMPYLTGPELYSCLKRFHPQIEVLFMSGYRPEQIDAAIVTSTNFIAKPFRPIALVERVNEILGNADVCVLLDDDAEPARA